jgi:hypothetical protein
MDRAAQLYRRYLIVLTILFSIIGLGVFYAVTQ